MFVLLLVLHVLICIVLVTTVLLQAGRGGGLASAFGGGGAQSIFGGRGAATFLSKATVVLGGLFFLTSLSLALLSSKAQTARSLVQEEARRASQTAPARPGAAPQRTTPAPGGTTPQGGQPAPQGGGTQPATPPPSGGR